MDYIRNSELWKCINDCIKFAPTSYHPNGYYTKIQWAKFEDEKKIKAEIQDVLLKSYIGKNFKGNFLISNITEDTVQAFADDVIISPYWPNTTRGIVLHFYYDESFKNKLLSFGKGGNGVNLEGKVISITDISFTGATITLELISIEKGCFIATVCYGDCEAREILMLRKYRDTVLLKSELGKIAISIYYFISPQLARLIEKSDSAKKFVRKHILDPIISRIQHK